MDVLNQKGFEKAKSYLLNNARYIEKLMFEHAFIQPCPEKIVKALSMYQNKDGGYGNALEPDFRVPNSSALATSIALEWLSKFDQVDEAIDQIQKAIDYLENTYKEAIKGWEDVPRVVNLFPHAPWWHRSSDIDFISGNPSAELVGYLIKYKHLVTKLDVDALTEVYLERFLHMQEFEVHEVLCYIRLYAYLSKEQQALIQPILQRAYDALVTDNQDAWNDYGPQPIKFVTASELQIIEVEARLLKLNLKYYLDQIEVRGYLVPTWKWGQYEEEWEVAKREWCGILTLDALMTFKRFNCLTTDT